jgi:ABC-type nickel/cobalt efflux system permease component RcnA
LAIAFGYGAAHALEPDHMAAVSSFVARRPSPREAASFGIKWATGHGLSLLVLGLVLWTLKKAVETRQPSLFSSGVLEHVVGAVLIGLGVWSLWQLKTGKASHSHHHGHYHDGHFHSHEPHTHEPDAAAENSPRNHQHDRGLGSLWMGLLHGAAGTGAFVGESAVALSGSFLQVFLYTLLFSLGVLVAMGAYAGLLGGLFTWSEKKNANALVVARALVGTATCVVGACLMFGVELPGLLDPFLSH